MDNNTYEIFDTISGTVISSGSITDLINFGYKLEWSEYHEKWDIVTWGDFVDDEIEEFLGTDEYDLDIREA